MEEAVKEVETGVAIVTPRSFVEQHG